MGPLRHPYQRHALPSIPTAIILRPPAFHEIPRQHPPLKKSGNVTFLESESSALRAISSNCFSRGSNRFIGAFLPKFREFVIQFLPRPKCSNPDEGAGRPVQRLTSLHSLPPSRSCEVSIGLRTPMLPISDRRNLAALNTSPGPSAFPRSPLRARRPAPRTKSAPTAIPVASSPSATDSYTRSLRSGYPMLKRRVFLKVPRLAKIFIKIS